MQINRHNYEEYFILYVDNELGSADRRLVEEFVKLHPDLQEELDILLQSKFTPDNHIVFEGKEELLFGHYPAINLSNYEEWMVLYMDNELDETQRAAVEQFTALHPELKNEIGLLLQTQLQPEAIVFPHKASLYRREENSDSDRKRPVIWWRMAAAAVLILLAGGISIVMLNKKSGETAVPELANAKPASAQPVKEQPAAIEKNNIAAVRPEIEKVDQHSSEQSMPSKKNTTVRQDKNIKTKAPALIVVPVTGNKNALAINDKKPSNNLPQPDENPYVKPTDNTATTGIVTGNIAPNKGLTGQRVTNQPDQPSFVSSVATPVDDEPDGKKNKLRGFFRKVTRTFEKRTNIEATDGDDRLLVGGLAIRLK